jgi:hypothetical protein
VGVEDSFFDLGGHSLIAVRLFAMVKKAFRVEFPISILFEAPTIAACAALIEDQIGGATDDGAEAARRTRARRSAGSPISCRCIRAKAGRRRRSSWWPACSAMC